MLAGIGYWVPTEGCGIEVPYSLGSAAEEEY